MKGFEMMNRTELVIAKAFWQLLEEKPYSKITVKNIVERCEINRNTFYYHFHDIPDLLDRILKRNANDIINKSNHFDNLIDCFIPIVEDCNKRKKAILNVYHSIQREIFVEHLNKIALYISEQYTELLTKDINILDQDKKLLIRFNKCVIVGIILDWLDSDANYDLITSFTRIYQILETNNKKFFY